MLDGAMIVWFGADDCQCRSSSSPIPSSTASPAGCSGPRGYWSPPTQGPVGLVFYLLACRRPLPGTHDAFTSATWKQALNSEMHCLAGDATGIVVAASILPVFGLTNGWDATVEYLAAFVSGLFIFQALMMVGMYDGDYWKAVRKTFFAETVSMNMVMTGMLPVMLILGMHWPGSEEPQNPSFWFRMSVATIVGGVVAYPINHWLVANRLKHGCMTLPGADTPAPGLGHVSPEPSMMMDHAQMQDATSSVGTALDESDHVMTELPTAAPQPSSPRPSRSCSLRSG